MATLKAPHRTILSSAAMVAPALMIQALSLNLPSLTAQMCADNSGWEKVLNLPEEMPEELINAK